MEVFYLEFCYVYFQAQNVIECQPKDKQPMVGSLYEDYIYYMRILSNYHRSTFASQVTAEL